MVAPVLIQEFVAKLRNALLQLVHRLASSIRGGAARACVPISTAQAIRVMRPGRPLLAPLAPRPPARRSPVVSRPLVWRLASVVSAMRRATSWQLPCPCERARLRDRSFPTRPRRPLISAPPLFRPRPCHQCLRMRRAAIIIRLAAVFAKPRRGSSCSLRLQHKRAPSRKKSNALLAFLQHSARPSRLGRVRWVHAAILPDLTECAQ